MAGGWSGRLGESCGGGGLDLLVGHWGCDIAGRGKRKKKKKKKHKQEAAAEEGGGAAEGGETTPHSRIKLSDIVVLVSFHTKMIESIAQLSVTLSTSILYVDTAYLLHINIKHMCHT